jgi:hypothetical protein
MDAGLVPMIATFGLNLSEPHSKSDTVQQTSTDPGLSTIKRYVVALDESRGTVPLCRRPTLRGRRRSLLTATRRDLPL